VNFVLDRHAASRLAMTAILQANKHRHCEEAKPTKQSSEFCTGSPRRFAARDDGNTAGYKHRHCEEAVADEAIQ
jgi:hypothetical protein